MLDFKTVMIKPVKTEVEIRGVLRLFRAYSPFRNIYIFPLKETMQRTHERKMETFNHLENLDLEKEEFVKLRINVERQLGQGIKRKRKRKRHSKKKTKGLSDEELEIKLEHVTEEVKESIIRKKPAFEIPEKLFTPLNNADYELSEPEISLLSK